jgi:hypothetical protein
MFRVVFIFLLAAWFFDAWWLALVVVGCMAGFELLCDWLIMDEARNAKRLRDWDRHQEMKRIIREGA